MAYSFRVGTFNVLNLILPNQIYYGKEKYTQEQYDKKIAWIAQQLDNMQVDIVGFQEVFSEEALKDVLQKTQNLKNAHIFVAKNSENDKPSVAVVSRFPITNTQSHLQLEVPVALEGMEAMPVEKFTRPILEVEIEVKEGKKINFYVAHLKSKRPILLESESRDNPLDQAKGEARSLLCRINEAVNLRAILLKKLKDRDLPLILVGDLNDTTTAVTTQIISGNPPFRKWPMEVKKNIWDVVLYHVKNLQARKSMQDMYYTHIHNGHYESLDHILVSQEFVSENKNGDWVVEYVRVFNDHLVDGTLSDDEVNYWQSDHAQVVAIIEEKFRENHHH
ncbi:MAG: endonuclease/exonuclease/phosphatase family protein [Bacteroidetes bacterium]|nr:MAG: endonuclease/exonuclease/phosphatase family protein [Bacteroidota bacterium]TAG87653.1 MAG: endonuclease/exonuclease/phosphatase family protein [Bacteroidota bacterium]